jgi:TIGR00730 family protein
MSELLAAADALAHIGPAVSVFGSARLRTDSPYYGLAEEIGRLLARAGFAVIAGGGPGIMEAANKGAIEAGGTSVGLNITLPFETANNAYQTIELSFEYFYSRKATFFMHSLAYVALPGGYGTMDELFEALTLMQTGKIPRGPVVLVGSSFWGGLIDWVRERMLAMGMISPADLDLFQVEDDPRSVVEIIAAFHDRQRNDALYVPTLPA